MVVMTLRRLLAGQSLNVRAVHKHVLLVMKILVRASGVEADGHEDVVAAFADLFPGHVPLPHPERVLPGADDPLPPDVVVAAADSVIDILSRIDQTVVRRVPRQ